MQAAPASDLLPFLQEDGAFDVELFTERTFGGLLEREARFDCVVVGYNAAHKSDVVRRALEERLPATNLCVLHQRRPETTRFLPVQLKLALVDLDERVEPVTLAEHVRRDDELLVNLLGRPALQTRAAGRPVLEGARALLALGLSKERVWRTVFEVEHAGRRRPVLVRTPSRETPRVLVCTALLEHVRDAHRELLRNMIAWCAAGRPQAVVVDAPDMANADVIQRKLHLQGVHSVAYRLPDCSALDFSAWPLRGAAHVILPRSWDPTEAREWPDSDPSRAEPWLRRGGRIVAVARGGELSVKHKESDLRWLVERWLCWFAGRAPASWHGDENDGGGSIVATRAMLQTLARIDAIRDVADPDLQLPLKQPGDFRRQVTALLRRRVGDLDNCDDTISTTAAVMELDRLVDGAGIRWEAMQAWLTNEDRWVHMAPEDRLEVARCLGPEGRALLHRVLRELPETWSATLVTKLREAIVACELEPANVAELTAFRDSVVERELEANPLLAANYLAARIGLRAHWADHRGGDSHWLAAGHLENEDTALMTIRRDGSLLADHRWPASDPELVCAEARALLAYFSPHQVATHAIQWQVETAPSQVLQSLLQEVQDLRDENATIPGLERRLALAGATVARAQNWLAGGVIAALASVVVLALIFVDSGILQVVGIFVAAMVWFLAFGLLSRKELAPDWALRADLTPQALGQAIARRVGRGPESPAPRPAAPIGSKADEVDTGPAPGSPPR